MLHEQDFDQRRAGGGEKVVVVGEIEGDDIHLVVGMQSRYVALA